MRKQTILFICKDVGAAHELAVMYQWMLTQSEFKIILISIGLSRQIFQQYGIVPDYECESDMELAKLNALLDTVTPRLLLFGTSMDSTTERSAVELTRKKKIPTIGLIDWWSNFGLRFSTPAVNTDLKFLPDMIAVPDQDARDGCIRDGIPSERIRVIGNPYWDFLLAQAPEYLCALRKDTRRQLGINNEQDPVVLIMSSNIRNLSLDLGYDETDFWRLMPPFPKETVDGRVFHYIIKPHPTESQDCLRDLVAKFSNVDCQPRENCSNFGLINAADIVCGMCSSALLEAALLKKNVVSVQPNKNFKKLQYMRIFDHLSIPVITSQKERDIIFEKLIQNKLPRPNLMQLPHPLGEGRSAYLLWQLMKKHISVTHDRSYT